MSDGIKAMFDEMAARADEKRKNAVMSKSPAQIVQAVQTAESVLFTYLSEDIPMTKFWRTRFETALKNLQELLK